MCSRTSVYQHQVIKNNNENSRTVQLINGKLHFDGYIYDKDKISGDLSYWHCRQYFKIRCLARATTTSNPSNSQEVIIIHRARQETRHNHPSILTEVNKSESNLKEIALEIDDVNIDLETTTTPMMIKEESKIEIDDSNLPSKLATKSEKLRNLTDGSELKRSSRLRVKREILVQVSDKYKGSTSAQLIGKRLFINGYIYSARQYAPNLIYWNCRGLKLKLCKATAITSNPITTNTMLMVRRGPEESKHSHPPSPAEVEEAELKAKKFEPKTNQRPPLQVTVVHPRPISRPTSEKISTGVKLEPKRLAPDRKKIESSKPVSNAGVPRLIDRKLCIDDYLYAKERQFPDRVQWKCSRYKKYRCLGRITTSVPSPRGKLIVLRGHDLSKHNHQPGTEDAIKAEKVVVEVEMKNKRNTNRQNTTNIQSSQTLTNTACSKSAEKAGMAKSTKSKLTPALTPRKRVISSTSNTGKPRLVGKKLCIDEYLYYKERQTSDKVHWKCYQYDKDRCRGRVTTSIPSSSGKLIVLGSDGLSKHHHQPTTEDIIKATKVVEVVTKNKRGTKRQKTTNIQHSLTPSNTSRSKSDETSGPAKSSKTKLTSSLTSRKRLTTSKNIQEVKKVGLLGDHRKYQQFLKTFSRNPIFSRENIIAAVKPFYWSNTGRVMAFAAILENREKVEADLKKLKKNPKVVINQVDVDSLDKNGNGGITDNQESMDAERIEPVIASTGMELADIPPPTENCYRHEEENIASDRYSPFDGLGENDQFLRCQTPIIDPRCDKSEKKQTIAVIDLTDDADSSVKQESTTDNDHDRNPMLASSESRRASISLPNPFANRKSNDKSRAESCLQTNFNFTTPLGWSGSQNRPQNQVAALPDVQNTFKRTSANDLFCPTVHSSNMSSPVFDIQIPLIINVPGLTNNGTSSIERYYTELQVYK